MRSNRLKAWSYGHEKLGLFLPPAPFQRRMWAAGEVHILCPLELGVPATKRSQIRGVSFKSGRTGDLCFVTVAHTVTQSGQTSIEETQTIVYRDRGLPEKALRQPDDPIPVGYHVYPDTQLVAYSSVLQNAHRIHWDRAFCNDVEGYPGLVVHGPLMATQLCDAMRGGAGACKYSYRALAPVFETTPVRILPGEPGGERKGVIERSDGVVSMKGRYSAIQENPEGQMGLT